MSNRNVLQPNSRLLSLPWELRDMIWKEVIGSHPYLLHTFPYPWSGQKNTTNAHCTLLSTSYHDTTCDSLHCKPARSYHLPPLTTEMKPPNPLLQDAVSWLRTCRLIYFEATKLLTANGISLRICDWIALAAALDGRTPSFHFWNIRSLTLCITIEVKTDMQGRFRPNNGEGRGFVSSEVYRFGKHFERRQEWQRRLWVWGSSSGKSMKDLETVNFNIIYQCNPLQGNVGPVVGRFKNSRQERVMLDRLPSCASRLRWVGDLEDFKLEVNNALDEWPSPPFPDDGGQPPDVNIGFELDGVRHDPWSVVPHVRDRCWCRGRQIDRKSVPVKKMEKTIRKYVLKGGDWDESASDSSSDSSDDSSG